MRSWVAVYAEARSSSRPAGGTQNVGCATAAHSAGSSGCSAAGEAPAPFEPWEGSEAPALFTK